MISTAASKEMKCMSFKCSNSDQSLFAGGISLELGKGPTKQSCTVASYPPSKDLIFIVDVFIVSAISPTAVDS